jgi:hypothetical protein
LTQRGRPKILTCAAVLAAWTLLGSASHATAADRRGIPSGGAVPDAKTALLIAKAVLTPVYGEDILRAEEPLRATLRKMGCPRLPELRRKVL